jgi:hypothetical protein
MVRTRKPNIQPRDNSNNVSKRIYLVNRNPRYELALLCQIFLFFGSIRSRSQTLRHKDWRTGVWPEALHIIAPLQKKGLLRCDVLNAKQLDK